MKRIDLIKLLEGREILSIQFEGTIGICNGKIIREGKVICNNPTKKELLILLKEDR